MNKFISLFLAVVMICSVFSTLTIAASATESDKSTTESETTVLTDQTVAPTQVSTETTYTVNGLTRGTDYNICVRARHKVNGVNVVSSYTLISQATL